MLSDMVEVEFERCGYQCSVRMNPRLFFRLGYVTVPKGHPAYASTFDEVLTSVHGGVTYSDISDDGEGWTIGFDCGHAFDAPDFEVARKALSGKELEDFERLYGMDSVFSNLFGGCEPHTWTTGEVVDEVIRLAGQLKEMEET